jgi:hypothetical protein
MIQVDIIEEFVELRNSGWKLSSVGKDFIQKIKCFSFFKESISIFIIFVENLHDHDSNILIFINWEVQEIFDEQKTFEF